MTLDALGRFLPALWEMSLTAAYAAAVVTLLRLFLKKRAPRQVLCLLWLVVFARLLVPVSLESPLSILPGEAQVERVQSLASGDPAAPVQTLPPIQSAAPIQDGGPALGPPADEPPAAVTSPDKGSTVPVLTAPSGMDHAVPAQTQAGFPWRAVLAGIWLAGVLAMGGYALASYLRLRRRLFDAIRACDGAWEHPSVASPFILGILRPRVYLPAGLTGQPRQFILCHERAHLKRLDHIVKPICWAALALHWFNPAVWLAFILMSRDIEAACDEAVIRQLGPRVKADYSATLLSLATSGRVPAPCPLAFDEGDAKGRIQNVLGYRRPALWIVVVSAVMALLAAVCLLTDPVSADAPEDGPSPTPSASQEPGAYPSPTPIPTPEPVPETPAMPGWAEDVLSGRRTFYSTDQEKQIDLEPLNAAYGKPDQYYDLDHKLALVDLDGDGEAEVILEPCYIGTPANESDQNLQSLGYLILHAEGDEVYGYTPGYLGFTDLKADGIYQFFAFASTPDYNVYDSGWGHVRFTDEGMEPVPITWAHSHADVYPNETDYYVDGEPASADAYAQAAQAYDRKPGPAWYRWYEDTGLLPAVINADQSTYTPKFLGDGLRELYRQASYFYYHLFGESTSQICGVGSNYSGLSYDPADTVERDGLTYVRATGRFARWNDLMAAADALFTRDFWDACNQWNGHALFLNVGGDTYFLPASRPQGDYYRADVAPFTLVSQTGDAVEVTLTAGYNRYQAGEDEAAWGQRLERGYDYTVDYPIRYVRTEQGWRLDEFHYGRTDHLDYTMGHLLWQPDPFHAVNGAMDAAALRQVGPDTLLDWDGVTYTLEPEVNANTFLGRMYVLDVDGDGETEASLVYRDEAGSAIIAVYEREGGGLRRITYNTSRLQQTLSDYTVVERDPDGGLTIEYRAPRETVSIQLTDAVFEGYEWMREGELYAAMDPSYFYVGLTSENPLEPPFAVHSFLYLTDGVNHGPYVASLMWQVEWGAGHELAPGPLYLEAYGEFQP